MLYLSYHRNGRDTTKIQEKRGFSAGGGPTLGKNAEKVGKGLFQIRVLQYNINYVSAGPRAGRGKGWSFVWKKRRVRLEINGVVCGLITQESDEYMRSLANELEEMLMEVQLASPLYHAGRPRPSLWR